jgi:periplasmic divalent cation tolerance protein
MSVVLALCNCPNDDIAASLARALVSAQLAACVNRLPGIASTYRWQGEIITEIETTLLIKTTPAAMPALKAFIEANHPYEVPELIVLPVTDGLPAYLAWVEAATRTPL